MFHGKGLPDKESVDDYLAWDIWWQGEGEHKTLDRALLRTFSSMFNGKGLPDKKSVDDYLAWDIWWQGEGEHKTLDRALLRSFSSMFSAKGLPDKEAGRCLSGLGYLVAGRGGDKTLDRALLRNFSSMFMARGCRIKSRSMPIWPGISGGRARGRTKPGTGRCCRPSRRCFLARGCRTKSQVDAYLAWDIWWQGEGENKTLDRALLRAFSSMFHGKGLPDQEKSRQMFQWLRGDSQLGRRMVPLMARLYCGAYAGYQALGLPDLERLRHYERSLHQHLRGTDTEKASDDGFESDDDESDDESGGITLLIKQVALYLALPNTVGNRHLSWPDCRAFLDRLSETRSTRPRWSG